MKYEAVIFDLDGTLINSLDDLADSMNIVLEKQGLETHSSESYKYFIGDGVEELIKRALPLKFQSEKKFINSCKEDFKQEYNIRCTLKTHPYDGILELLNSLSEKNIKLSVLSNKPHDFTLITVAKFFPEIKFSCIYGANKEKPLKPNPQMCLEISKELNLPCNKFLYLGDTSIDMLCANNAGMASVGVTWGFRTKDELLSSGAKYIINHPAELLDLF
ncbi:MAG: hypothetical protein ACD_79C00554G0001 [uncultured bacterium]|nr:MAG: hypothetical protein ACD_79C00554G0001 [uncultured bacterium]